MNCQYVKVYCPYCESGNDTYSIGYTDDIKDPDYTRCGNDEHPRATITPFRLVTNPLFFIEAASSELENANHHSRTEEPMKLWKKFIELLPDLTEEQKLKQAHMYFSHFCPWAMYMFTEKLKNEEDAP